MKKLLSIILYMALVAAVVLPLTMEETHAAFSQRTKIPAFDSKAGKTYYYTDDNVFYKHNLGPNQKYLSGYKGYCTGNCTWYAYGRASEILGEPLNTEFRWSASSWWDINKEGNYYPYGSTPKVGAIACYSSHVAVVEKVENGQPYVSESAWTVSENKPVDASQLKFHYGSPWQKDLKGYIYITDEAPDTIKADYSIRIDIDNLNMRTGPGTGHKSAGYAPKGTYRVDQENGNWLRLADNGYWVCADYVTKVNDDVPEPQDEAEKKPANQKVKITVKNLNMRKGPAKKYKSMGTLAKGTYIITETKNGWGKLKKNGYWIKLAYTAPLSGEYEIKVTTDDLNMRKGPGKSYKRMGYIRKGTHTIAKVKGNWGKIKSNGYWVNLSYVKRI